LEDLILGESYEFSVDLLSGMLTVETAFTPQLLGQILNCNLTLHIDEILKWYFPSFSWLIDLFFDDIYFKINPIISGYLEADAKLGNSIYSLNWDSAIKDFNLNLDIPELSYGDTLSLELTNFQYGINFQVDWFIGYDTGWGISWLFGAGDEYKLTTWPNLNLDLTPLEGTIGLKTWNAGINSWISDETEEVSEPAIGSYCVLIMLGIVGVISVIYIRRKIKE